MMHKVDSNTIRRTTNATASLTPYKNTFTSAPIIDGEHAGKLLWLSVGLKRLPLN